MKHLWIAAVAAFAPMTAAAQSFTPPAGCEPRVTVQQTECKVSNYYTCPGDADGSERWVDIGPDGLLGQFHTGANGEWLEADFLEQGVWVTEVGAAQPIDHRALLASGSATVDFIFVRDDGFRLNYRGNDTLTGEETVIGGQRYQLIYSEWVGLDAETGEQYFEISSVAYLQPDTMFQLPGTDRTENSDGSVIAREHRPIQVLNPGDPGFFAAQPRFDCGAN